MSCEQTPLATDLRQVSSQLCPWDAWVCLAPSVLSSGREEGCRSSPLKPQPRTPPQPGCREASEAAGRSSGTRHSAGTPRRVAAVSWPARGPPPPTSSSSDPRRRDPPGPHPTRPEDAELPSRGKVDSFGRSPSQLHLLCLETSIRSVSLLVLGPSGGPTAPRDESSLLPVATASADNFPEPAHGDPGLGHETGFGQQGGSTWDGDHREEATCTGGCTTGPVRPRERNAAPTAQLSPQQPRRGPNRPLARPWAAASGQAAAGLRHSVEGAREFPSSVEPHRVQTRAKGSVVLAQPTAQ